MRADPDLAHFFSQRAVSHTIVGVAFDLIPRVGEHVSLDGQ